MKKAGLFVLLLFLLAPGLCLGALGEERVESADAGLLALAGKRFGVQTGSVFDTAVKSRVPDAQVYYFETFPDLVQALEGDKIDAFLADEPLLRAAMREKDTIRALEEPVDRFEYAFAFPKSAKGEALRSQFNDYLRTLRGDGTLQRLEEKWFGGEESEVAMPDYEALPATNGTVRLAAEYANVPFEYMRGGQSVGYEIEIAAGFCRQYGYGLQVTQIESGSLLAAVQTGACDFGASAITVTEERGESVLFSEPDYSGSVLVAVRKEEGIARTEEMDRLNGAAIGVQVGSIFDAIVLERLPKAQILYFNTKADLLNALTSHKIAGFAVDGPVAGLLEAESDQLQILSEPLDSYEMAYLFPKTQAGEELCAQMSAFLEKLDREGTLSEIEDNWMASSGEKKMPDAAQLTAENGTLRMATECMYEPFSYIKDNAKAGYDLEIAVRFCAEYGYGLEIVDMSFDSILPAVQSGKCEFAASGISITEERKESVLFSRPNYQGSTVMVVLRGENGAAGGKRSFAQAVKESFSRTFLREERWKMFLEGTAVTLMITLLSMLFGTALGFLLFMLCRKGSPAALAISGVSIWLVQGMPMVVLLMILYYVVFGQMAVSGMAVAVVAFTLTFGSSVFGLLRSGVGAVDPGQYEAAYALGYSDLGTFFRIILPQALPHMLPGYRWEVIGLIKATAIVGYIAVQDLTKMGDIVRSRTYEAFFPLIAVTVIYFLLEGLFNAAVKHVGKALDPKRRRRETILKGVDLHD